MGPTTFLMIGGDLGQVRAPKLVRTPMKTVKRRPGPRSDSAQRDKQIVNFLGCLLKLKTLGTLFLSVLLGIWGREQVIFMF